MTSSGFDKLACDFATLCVDTFQGLIDFRCRHLADCLAAVNLRHGILSLRSQFFRELLPLSRRCLFNQLPRDVFWHAGAAHGPAQNGLCETVLLCADRRIVFSRTHFLSPALLSPREV